MYDYWHEKTDRKNEKRDGKSVGMKKNEQQIGRNNNRKT